MTELSFPDPPLTDGIVMLRAWMPEDLVFVVEACEDAEVSRYSPTIPFPYTDDDALRWFESQEPARLAGHAIDFAVTASGTGQLLGAIGLNMVSHIRRAATTGYWLAPAAREHGHVSRAVRLLARWAFDELGLARLKLTTDPENVASQRVAERCGFQKEGRLRSHLLVRHSGQRRDSLVYGLLLDELTEASSDKPSY